MSKFYVKAWSGQWIAENTFPEEQLESFKTSYTNKNIGLAFSGGGTRSATCTLGQLKACHELNLLPKIKYISAVSGGAWAATPFTYIAEHQLTDFFGRISEPEEIDSGIYKSVLKDSFQHCIVASPVLKNLLKAASSGRGDESYADSLGKIFLQPFGLHNPKSSFTFNNETLTEAEAGIKAGTSIGTISFDVSRNEAPFLILGATLLNEDGLSSDKKYHVEYTPYYSGVRVFHQDKEFLSQDDYFGGGYITSCGYDCMGPYKKSIIDGVEKLLVKRSPKSWSDLTDERAFSLSDIMASTGAAPQDVTANLGLGALGFPEFNHIPISVPSGQNQVAEEYPHSDGGHLENLGVMPLLARKVPKMFVFINTKKPFIPNEENWLASSLNKSLKALFVPVKNIFSLSDFKTNIVFKNGESELTKIIKQFADEIEQEQSSGEYVAKTALIASSTLITQGNKFYGVIEDHVVDVLWIYNCRSKAWEDKLADRELAKIISKNKKLFGSQKGLEDFPHYGTFFENAKAVIGLTPSQTNLLTDLSYWVAKHALLNHLD